jgi:phosphatidate cytidylyltransferase
MPHNTHTTRIKTAAVLLVILAVVGLIDSAWITWLFLGFVYALALSEALPLLRIEETTPYLYAAAIWITESIASSPGDPVVLALLVLGGWLAYRADNVSVRTLGVLLYPTIGMVYIWGLYGAYGMTALLWMLVTVALTDIGAYYTGRAVGRTPFSPTSPNKTLEGVVGGVIAGTVGGTVVATGWMEIGFFAALIISLIGAKFSIFGDLFESWLKRQAGVKDSGMILPGHGGVLDRIDGYLFAAPALYILLHLFGY